MTHKTRLKRDPYPLKQWAQATLATLGLAGLMSGCNSLPSFIETSANAQTQPSATPTSPATPTATATPSPTATNTPHPTPTPWPTLTVWPTPTPWPTPVSWQPASEKLPTLAPLTLPAIVAPPPTLTPVPVVSGGVVAGEVPVAYSPPDGVDVFGNTILRWEFPGQLAEDEFFDIKIRPMGSDDSVFVDWTKATEYELRPWGHWEAGLYTWQIGIIRGELVGETKNFIADTGRNSQPFVIKWQAAGGDHGGGGSGGSGGSSGSS